MPQVGFEPMIPVFRRAKTVHALDRATTVIGAVLSHSVNIITSTIIARQRVGKHVPAEANARNNGTSIARQ
jgi:hypothetical protein